MYLNKTDIAGLLRELGKSEVDIRMWVEELPTEQVDFMGFQDFMKKTVLATASTTGEGLGGRAGSHGRSESF